MGLRVAWFGMLAVWASSVDIFYLSDARNCPRGCELLGLGCLPKPAHQLFSYNILYFSVPDEAYSRASGTLKCRYDGSI